MLLVGHHGVPPSGGRRDTGGLRFTAVLTTVTVRAPWPALGSIPGAAAGACRVPEVQPDACRAAMRLRASFQETGRSVAGAFQKTKTESRTTCRLARIVEPCGSAAE